jgi:acyl homoserine lactone synthase
LAGTFRPAATWKFDGCPRIYLLQREDDGRVQGCVRLLRTTGSTMLRDTFPALLDGQAAVATDTIWEGSRFGVDRCTREAKTAGSIARATYELFAGMIEFGLTRQLTDIITVTDARIDRILCRACCLLKRLGAPRAIGKTIAVGRLPRSLARATFLCSGSRRSRQASDRRGRRPTRTIHADWSDGDGGRVER